MKVFPEVFNSFVGKIPVEPHPAEFLGNEAFGFERLHELQYIKVADRHSMMLGSIEVFLCTHDSLIENVVID